MLSEYNVRAEYVGDGATSDYTFDFKIADLEHLLVAVSDATFVETFNVRGSDTTYLTTVDFDAINGTGTVTLATALPLNHNLAIILANDQPLQESQFRDKGDFSLARFEAALDVQAGAIQRLAYLAKRSLKMSELVLDSAAFDATIPFPEAGKTLVINATEDGFDLSDGVDFFAEIPTGVTLAAPQSITTAGGITVDATANRQRVFVKGSAAGENIVTANPQVSAGTVVDQVLILNGGTDGGNYITLNSGTGLLLSGSWSSLNYSSLTLFWDGSQWSEDARSEK